MENRSQIRQRIRQDARRGDWKDVAERVGLQSNTVHKIVRGTRENDKVLQAFVDLLDARQAAKEKYQSTTQTGD